MPLSYIELSAENLVHNVRALRGLLKPGIKVAVAVKGNAYGHGMEEVAQALEGSVDFFQVDDLEELRRLRAVSQKPVLVLGYVGRDELEETVGLGGSLAIYGTENLDALDALGEKAGHKVKIHLDIDALLGREGILPEALPEFLERLKQCPWLEVEGVYAHFANIEDTSDFSHAQKQIEAYAGALRLVREAGFDGFLTHISSTAGSLVHEQAEGRQDLVRIGIGAYGLWPSEELRERYSGLLELRPALRWVSHVAQVKELPAGRSIGYGLTYVTDRPMTVALVPQGYSDGYDRGLSGCGEVLIRGSRCTVLGRVSMNMLTVDVSDVAGAQLEDEVVLLGRQGDEHISAEELAELLLTINYEVVTRISPLLERKLG